MCRQIYTKRGKKIICNCYTLEGGRRKGNEKRRIEAYIAPTITKSPCWLINFSSHSCIHFTVLNHRERSTTTSLNKYPNILLWISLLSIQLTINEVHCYDNGSPPVWSMRLDCTFLTTLAAEDTPLSMKYPKNVGSETRTYKHGTSQKKKRKTKHKDLSQNICPHQCIVNSVAIYIFHTPCSHVFQQLFGLQRCEMLW